VPDQQAVREIDGTVVWRGDAAYEETRRSVLWNELKAPRFPEVIVRPALTQGVVAAVGLARSRGLKVAVRGGGHSLCGAPLRDGGMVIDLSALGEFAIDPASRTATLHPAVTSREFAAALAEHELAFPVGHCGPVGLSGFILGGGFGWNTGAWGPACFSLLAVDVVTAKGELVRADERENPELLWAARGAGPGFFGVVTRFHIGLQALPRAITTSTYRYPLADLAEITPWATRIAGALPPTVELTLLVAPAPPGITAPAEGKVVVVTATAFVDSIEDAAGLLAPLESCPSIERALARQINEPTPFEALFDIWDALMPQRHRYRYDSLWSDQDFAGLLPNLAEPITNAPASKAFAFAIMPPAPPADAQMPDVAFSMVGRTYLGCAAVYENEENDDANGRWLRKTMQTVEPHAIGHYINETDLLADSSRAMKSFAKPNWDRLQALTQRLDPDGVFHSYLGPN
jgi:FAD/FMN-containing dehydrogenase